MDNKKGILIGLFSLLVSAILQAVFSCYLQNAWIVLVFTCIYAVIFLKYLKSEESVKWLESKFSRENIKIAGTIILIIGLAFLPQFWGQYLGGKKEFVVYVVSYICWMVGLLLIDISKSTKDFR